MFLGAGALGTASTFSLGCVKTICADSVTYVHEWQEKFIFVPSSFLESESDGPDVQQGYVL